MSRFVQLHLLTSYPPANLNRDDLGRPKTAVMGGEPRLRISSQSLKRAWRSSSVFEEALAGHIGVRTRTMGITVFNRLYEKGVKQKEALAWAKLIAAQFGKLKTLPEAEKRNLKALDKDARLAKEVEETEIEQLAHFSPKEQLLIDVLIDALAERKTGPKGDELALLRRHHSAADIALFGRMLAAAPRFNAEAAAQVAHAISVHAITVEDDFFTAVDDLNLPETGAGAAFLGETEFAAGLFYLYLCIDKALLLANLSGNQELAGRTLGALVECAATVAPSGKQNSFASRARASYILCETGDQQPRSLSVAFLQPVPRGDMLRTAVNRLHTAMENMDTAYGACAGARCTMNVAAGEGTLQAVIEHATQG